MTGKKVTLTWVPENHKLCTFTYLQDNDFSFISSEEEFNNKLHYKFPFFHFDKAIHMSNSSNHIGLRFPTTELKDQFETLLLNEDVANALKVLEVKLPTVLQDRAPFVDIILKLRDFLACKYSDAKICIADRTQDDTPVLGNRQICSG